MENHRCKTCGKIMSVKFGSGLYCCRSCANTRSHSLETKLKISESEKRSRPRKEIPPERCKVCGTIGCSKVFCARPQILKIIKNLVEHFNFDSSTIGTPKVEEEFNRLKNYLFKLYWEEKKSTTEIAQIFNYKFPNNLNKVFYNLGIPMKSCSYATAENYLQGRSVIQDVPNSKYKQGYYNKPNGEKVFLRSSYEFDFARILDELNLQYKVEPFKVKYFDTLKNRYRIAIPDFFIEDLNLIVEVKSSHTLNIQEMIDKVKEYKNKGFEFLLWYEHKFVDLLY